VISAGKMKLKLNRMNQSLNQRLLLSAQNDNPLDRFNLPISGNEPNDKPG